MAMSNKASLSPIKGSISASFGGAAGGTSLIGFINTLNLEVREEQILLLLTPWLSLIFALILNWLLKKAKYSQQERLIDSQLRKARALRDEILSDLNATEEEKVNAHHWYSSMQQYKRRFHKEVLKSISEDVEAFQVNIHQP